MQKPLPGPVPAERPAMGWREWIALPDFGVDAIEVKVDTGARSSALHAFESVRFRRGGRRMVRFKIHPFPRNLNVTMEVVAELQGVRKVRSSSGRQELRPWVLATVEYGGQRWPIELTLTARDAMGFRMLLGREAIRGRFNVDPDRSWIGGKPAVASRYERSRSRKRKVVR